MRARWAWMALLLGPACFRAGFEDWQRGAGLDAGLWRDAALDEGVQLDTPAVDRRAPDARADDATGDDGALDAAVGDGTPGDAAADGGGADTGVDAASGDAGPSLRAFINASRLTGVAPLAVFFDASATQAPGVADPVHALEFHWSFGDAAAGTWATSGLSRDEARGPVAAHVFQAPGTYQVELTVRHATGETRTQVQIAVSDPDSVFAGDNSVCLSIAGDFVGAPAGCRQVTSGADLADVIAALAPGRRVLLRRGETWTASTWYHPNVAGPGLLGAFGTGAKPRIVQSGNDTVLKLSGSVPELADWRIQDLQVVGSGGDQSQFIAAGGEFRDVLVQRVDLSALSSGVCVHDSILDYLNTHGSPGHQLFSGLFVVDTTMTAMVSPGRSLVCYRGRRLALLGNDLQPATAAGDRLVNVGAEGAVLAHNRLRGTSVGLIGVDGLAPSSPGVTQGVATTRVVIADNDLELSGGALWPLAVRTSDSASGHIHHVRVERNRLRGTASSNAWAALSGSQLLVRNNVFEVTTGDKCLSLGPGAPDLAPADYRVLHNTCGAPGSGDVRLVYVQPGLPAVELANNLVVGDGATAVLENGSEASVVTAGNMLLPTSTLVAGSPFELAAGSLAIDAADPTYGVDIDLRWQPRPVDGDGIGGAGFDVGAFEFR